MHRSGWLRAAVMGANDGIVSTASLVIGVAAADASAKAVFTAGLAGMVAGALSMGLGEYVSVSSQRDTEQADLQLEQDELERHPEQELEELRAIYVGHGLSEDLASQVAAELTARDALRAHAREELNIVEQTRARPMQAALFSMGSFAVGAVLPLAVVATAPLHYRIAFTAVAALSALAGLGSVAARLGGASLFRPMLRVVIGGALALALSGLIGRVAGIVV
jgi:vacuolar iron transporter family protein